MEDVVGENKMLDSDWEQQLADGKDVRFRKLPGFAAAKQDILLYCEP